MYTFTQRLLRDASSVRASLKHEPKIRPSFALADLETIAIVIFCAIEDGQTDTASLCCYLHERGCPFDRKTIDFLLEAFEGEDSARHLWSRDWLGSYHALHPRPEDENFDDFL